MMTPEQVFFLVGGIALLAIGASVAALRPRSATALALAAFAGGLGIHGVMAAVVLAGKLPIAPVVWLADGLTAAGCWSLYWRFPTRLGRPQRLEAVLAASVGLTVAAIWILLEFESGLFPVPMIWGGPFAPAVSVVTNILGSGGLIALILILPLRARRVPRDEERPARSVAFVAVGLLFFTAGTFAEIASVGRGEIPLYDGIFDAFSVLVPTVLWVWATRGAHPGLARSVVLAAVGIYLSSLVVGPGLGWGVGRTLGALLLAYAVLRGEIEGLDLKLRFAISRSTLAAAFVAAFFVTSEGAQIVFGQRNEWIGLLAAGALVFVIAPLQRVAERLAEKAVPLPAGTITPVEAPPGAGPNPEDAYRKALRLALRDRILSRDDELELAELAEVLGIGAGRAAVLVREVERDLGVVP